MSEELLEILEPIIEPEIVLREQKALEKGIKGVIEALRYLGHNNMEIREAIRDSMIYQKKNQNSICSIDKIMRI